ncbi:MAG: hypothetical protein ACRDWD_13605 [Acidimicrobiia bacterium]
MCSYRDNFDDFSGVDAVVLGISPQDVDSHENGARSEVCHSRCSPTPTRR